MKNVILKSVSQMSDSDFQVRSKRFKFIFPPIGYFSISPIIINEKLKQFSFKINMNMVFGGIDVEQAKFKVVKKMENFEIRQYEPHIRIEVEMDSDEYTDGSKFMDLGGYIFGKNKSKDTGLKKNIAMTVRLHFHSTLRLQSSLRK
jgi:hypothetical protein